jgi:valyl-tRNA synthetase
VSNNYFDTFAVAALHSGSQQEQLFQNNQKIQKIQNKIQKIQKNQKKIQKNLNYYRFFKYSPKHTWPRVNFYGGGGGGW